jgi:hypothetical protein
MRRIENKITIHKDTVKKQKHKTPEPYEEDRGGLTGEQKVKM